MLKRKISLICIIALLASLLTACGNEVIVTPHPTTNTLTEQDTSTNNTQNNASINEEHPDEIEYIDTINGADQTVLMQRYDLSFQDWEACEAGVYIDSTAYDAYSSQGGYLVVPKDCGEVSTFMEIRYFSDMSEDDLAAGIFDLYASDVVSEDLVGTYTDNGVARYIWCQTADGTEWAAFIIPVEAGGCVSFVICLPSPEYEAHVQRFVTIVTTFFEK